MKMNKEQRKFIDVAEKFAIDAHEKTNHFYDTYLPYSFHLRMVVKACHDFLKLIPENKRHIVVSAGFLHDSIEDARLTYNDVKSVTNVEVAEIVRAVTNYGRGRDRNERMPDFVYDDIRNTEFATFVKLADRIANVQYSKMTGSSMFKKYSKEQEHFKSKLFVDGQYIEMWEYLDNIFNS
jgi:(p)ppGpp synthase/HD superfamily hydrolase